MPNSSQIPLARSNIISQEAADLVMENIYYGGNQTVWTPHEFITAIPTSLANNYDADVEQFANDVGHPVVKETVIQYQKVKDNTTIGEVG